MSNVVDSNSFKGKDEINQAVCTANLVLFVCCLKRRRSVGHEEDSFSLLLFLLWLVLTWCGPLSHLFLTVCVSAVGSPPQSRLCHPPPFPLCPSTRVQALQGSSALGTSPATSPRSTGPPPCQISPSLIPPARGGGGGGRGIGWRVIWRKQVWEYHRARGMNGLKQGEERGEWGDKLDVVKTPEGRVALAQPYCTEHRYPAEPSHCGTMKHFHNSEVCVKISVRLVSNTPIQWLNQCG